MATAMLLVFVFADSASLIHHLSTQHAICPQHGESIHVAPGDLAHALSNDLSAQQTGQSVDWTPPPGSEHEHEHCFLCSPSSECIDGAAEAAHTPPEIDPPEVERVCASQALPQTQIPLILLAPKNSPPHHLKG